MPAHFLTLANNHILDQGAQGLASTMQTLDAAGIAYAGAGHTRAEARKPWIRQVGDQKIGIYCCAEHEFSIAPPDSPGANPFDPLESFDDVASLRKDCDYLIVLYHGGKEHYRYPSPNLQKICRKFVRAGANLVVCQHSHCVGCKEDYQDGTIVYGQGNFLFDDSDSEFWQTSLLLSVTDSGVSYLPLVKRKNTVRLAHGRRPRRFCTVLKNEARRFWTRPLSGKNTHASASSCSACIWGHSRIKDTVFFSGSSTS